MPLRMRLHLTRRVVHKTLSLVRTEFWDRTASSSAAATSVAADRRSGLSPERTFPWNNGSRGLAVLLLRHFATDSPGWRLDSSQDELAKPLVEVLGDASDGTQQQTWIQRIFKPADWKPTCRLPISLLNGSLNTHKGQSWCTLGAEWEGAKVEVFVENCPVPRSDWWALADEMEGVKREPPVLPPPTMREDPPPGPPGGAMALNSVHYVVREVDKTFLQAIERRESIVLLKGARQVGKTSLLARGLAHARKAGRKVVVTDFQKLNTSDFQSTETLFKALASAMTTDLSLRARPVEKWDPGQGANWNFDMFVRKEVLGKIPSPLVWGLDEADRLVTCSFCGEIFGLFRSWHNARSLDPPGPWSRLTMAIAYATEPHLFIPDVNQSPFNVGTKLTLEDFTFQQVEDLNRRHGGPLGDNELTRFFELVGGHPYLVQCGLHELVTRHRGTNMAEFAKMACGAEGVFGYHLRRIRDMLSKNQPLLEAVRGMLRGRPCPSQEVFYRLRTAGVFGGDSMDQARPRCQLYDTYLRHHLL